MYEESSSMQIPRYNGIHDTMRREYKWHKRFSDGRCSLMDDKREGRPSFKTSDVVKNEVREVIDGDRRLTVREVADKCVISKTTVHDILFQHVLINIIDRFSELRLIISGICIEYFVSTTDVL